MIVNLAGVVSVAETMPNGTHAPKALPVWPDAVLASVNGAETKGFPHRWAMFRAGFSLRTAQLTYRAVIGCRTLFFRMIDVA